MSLTDTLLRLPIPLIVLSGILVAINSIARTAGSFRTRYAASLKQSFVFLVTFWAIFSGTGHLFFGKQIREKLGWQGPQFQFELGVFSLSLGFASIVATSGRTASSADSAKATLALTWGLFVAVAGAGHVFHAQYLDAAPDLLGGLYLVTSSLALF